MVAQNRAALIKTTLNYAKKKFNPAPAPPERSLLEHWIYGCCLENAHHEEADKAYQAITEAAFDWNEIRVTTVTELAEQMSAVANPREAATRVKRTLQSVFEWKYTYDLESLKKQNLGKTEQDLLRLTGTSPFSVSYVVQNALGGHSIPIDQGLLDAMYIIGVIDEKERSKNAVPGLERAIAKKDGLRDGSLLHQLGAVLFRSPYSPATREMLLAINPDAKPRLPKRQRKPKAKPDAEPAADAPTKREADKAKTTTGKTTKKKVAAKVEPAKKKAASKAAPRKKPSAAPKKKKKVVKKKAIPATTKKGTKKKVAKKKTASPTKKKKKKSTTKQLTRRKPR